MNAKEYLSQALWLDEIIKNKLEQQEEVRAMAERITVDMSQEKVSGGPNTISPMENSTVKLIDLSNEIDECVDRFVDLKREIQSTISKLEDMSYQLLLEMRYINNKGWNDIANGMGYDKRWVMRLHGRALKEIEEILNKPLKAIESHPNHVV